MHVVALLLLLAVAAVETTKILQPHRPVMPLNIRYYPPPIEAPGGGGRTSGEEIPETPQAKPRPAPKAFQPRLMAVNYDPQLAVHVVLTDAPGIDFNTPGIGELPGIPGGTGFDGIAGPPGPGGKGGRNGDGEGPGNGAGKGTFGISTAKVTRSPQLIYKEEPEYSEAARKAHIQGTVRLYIDVGVDGLATNIRVVQGVGLGLDESAVAAVRKWRFRPALSGDQPVVAPAVVDVGFFLL